MHNKSLYCSSLDNIWAGHKEFFDVKAKLVEALEGYKSEVLSSQQQPGDQNSELKERKTLIQSDLIKYEVLKET